MWLSQAAVHVEPDKQCCWLSCRDSFHANNHNHVQGILQQAHQITRVWNAAAESAADSMRGHKRGTKVSKVSTLLLLITKLTTGLCGKWQHMSCKIGAPPSSWTCRSTCLKHNMHDKDQIKLHKRSHQEQKGPSCTKEWEKWRWGKKPTTL